MESTDHIVTHLPLSPPLKGSHLGFGIPLGRELPVSNRCTTLCQHRAPRDQPLSESHPRPVEPAARGRQAARRASLGNYHCRPAPQHTIQDHHRKVGLTQWRDLTTPDASSSFDRLCIRASRRRTARRNLINFEGTLGVIDTGEGIIFGVGLSSSQERVIQWATDPNSDSAAPTGVSSN